MHWPALNCMTNAFSLKNVCQMFVRGLFWFIWGGRVWVSVYCRAACVLKVHPVRCRKWRECATMKTTEEDVSCIAGWEVTLGRLEEELGLQLSWMWVWLGPGLDVPDTRLTGVGDWSDFNVERVQTHSCTSKVSLRHEGQRNDFGAEREMQR